MLIVLICTVVYYLLVGVAVAAMFARDCEKDVGQFLRLSVAWLPAFVNERVNDWIFREARK